MPTFRHGKNTRILIDEFDLSNMLREVNTTGEADAVETSAFGTTDKTYVVGLIGGGASFSGMFSGGAGETDAVFNSLVGDDTDHVVTIAEEGTGSVSIGKKATLMPGKMTARAVPASITDMVGITGQIVSDGPSRQGVLLHEYATAETTTGNSTSVDGGAASTFGGAAHLHVPINSRNGTGIFKIQHSTDDAAWADLITFTTISATTVGKQRLTVAGTVNRYVRGQWTIAGSSGSYTFALAFARYPF